MVLSLSPRPSPVEAGAAVRRAALTGDTTMPKTTTENLRAMLPACTVWYGAAIADRVHRYGWHARTCAGLTVYLGKSKDEAAEEAKRLGRVFGSGPV